MCRRSLGLRSYQPRTNEIAVHLRDHLEFDLFGADRFTFADVGATAEELAPGLGDHCDGALPPLGLALGEESQMGDFGAHK